jgi:hypothetical protein
MTAVTRSRASPAAGLICLPSAEVLPNAS